MLQAKLTIDRFSALLCVHGRGMCQVVRFVQEGSPDTRAFAGRA
jgi:hypothetical protein